MTAATHTPPTGLTIWWAIPMTVRRLLQARVPLEAAAVGSTRMLVFAVGGGQPLRWVVINPEDGRADAGGRPRGAADGDEDAG